MKKPELVIPAGSIEEIEKYLASGADAFEIGEERFGLRLPGNIEEQKMAEAIGRIHQHSAKAYVVVNKLFDNEELKGLTEYLAAVASAGADAIVFGDPAVLVAAKQAGTELPFHWNAEMTSTNYETSRYWASKGASRVILARELNLRQVLEFKENVTMEVQVQVHGATNIYHSRRPLVNTYREHIGVPASELGPILESRGLYLIEEERQDQHYPIYEDSNGTHIMSSEDVCMLEDLEELLEAGIDSFKIESLMKPPRYNEIVLEAYRTVIDRWTEQPTSYTFREEWLDAIRSEQPEDRELTFGFFYKEQVY